VYTTDMETKENTQKEAGKMTKEHKAEFCKAMRELMAKYDEFKAKWEKRFGTDLGFNEWFSRQCGVSKGVA